MMASTLNFQLPRLSLLTFVQMLPDVLHIAPVRLFANGLFAAL
jgi:hypothetical protein